MDLYILTQEVSYNDSTDIDIRLLKAFYSIEEMYNYASKLSDMDVESLDHVCYITEEGEWYWEYDYSAHMKKSSLSRNQYGLYYYQKVEIHNDDNIVYKEF